MKKLCLIIKELREKKLISQKSMADQLFMTQSSYSRIETGKTQITLDIFVKISAILELSPIELMEIYTSPNKNKTSVKDIEELLNRIDFKQTKAIQRLEAQNEDLRQMFNKQFNSP